MLIFCFHFLFLRVVPSVDVLIWNMSKKNSIFVVYLEICIEVSKISSFVISHPLESFLV